MAMFILKPYKLKDTFCRKCGVKLILGENCYESMLKRYNYICKKCEIERVRIHYNTHPEFRKRRLKHQSQWGKEHRSELSKKTKTWRRVNALGQNGRYIHVKKRDYPEGCELCGKSGKMLMYHHWNDNNLSLGIWVCHICHMIVETDDHKDIQQLLHLYHEKRQQIENEGKGVDAS